MALNRCFGAIRKPVFSTSYHHPKPFHGDNMGSNPIGDANKIKG